MAGSSSASVATVSAFSFDELSDYLFDKVSETVLLKLRQEKICGMDFVNLSDGQLKELFPVMGERMLVSRIIKEKNDLAQTVRN